MSDDTPCRESHAFEAGVTCFCILNDGHKVKHKCHHIKHPEWARMVHHARDRKAGEVMGTKRNPGDFDCYAKAEADEPMFVLLARDSSAAALVEAWAEVNEGRMLQPTAKIEEARACAKAMRAWWLHRQPHVDICAVCLKPWDEGEVSCTCGCTALTRQFMNPGPLREKPAEIPHCAACGKAWNPREERCDCGSTGVVDAFVFGGQEPKPREKP